jgi:hypothetical protein
MKINHGDVLPPDNRIFGAHTKVDEKTIRTAAENIKTGKKKPAKKKTAKKKVAPKKAIEKKKVKKVGKKATKTKKV